MDSQADKLRCLVRAVREAAAVATGPPTIAIFAAGDHQLGDQMLRCLHDLCAARSISTSSPNASWQLVQLKAENHADQWEQWRRASVLIIVTRSDDESVMECYKHLKLVVRHAPLPPLEFVVTDHVGYEAATVACNRLAQTCQRFLHSSISGTLVCTATDDTVAASMEPLVDRLLAMPPVASIDSVSPIAVHNS